MSLKGEQVEAHIGTRGLFCPPNIPILPCHLLNTTSLDQPLIPRSHIMSSTAAVANPRSAEAAKPAADLAQLRLRPRVTIPANAAPAFVVPTILITPPDAPARYTSPIPEQQYEKSVLFVPVRTEELGWDEHGLYWNGTYAYPVHQIYDKEGSPIGRRRKGPQGYRFEEYYENKKPRRSSSSTTDEGVEEASVRLDEPAPARIESNSVSRCVEEELDEADKLDEEMEDMASPTLSVASEMTETEDGSSSICDDSSSLWSRNDAESEDEESICTSPGDMSPPMEVDREEFAPETLIKKLSDLPTTDKATATSWISLGTLPSSSTASASSSRSQSLPTAREISHTHRASSTLIMDSPKDTYLHNSPTSAYSSIIQDLTTSPFAAASPSAPFRSATLPRSRSRSGYSSSKASGAGSSILRAPPSFATASSSGLGRCSSTSSSSLIGRRRSGGPKATSDIDFSAGWNFENQTASMSNRWDSSFANDY